jgi:adenylosuccinate synthase
VLLLLALALALAGIRVGDLLDTAYFSERVDGLVSQLRSQYPALAVDVAREKAYYAGVQAELAPLILDTTTYCHAAMNSGKKVLIEGANAAMLDIDFGTYPYVTSSNPSIGSVCSGLGIPPNKINRVTGIVKAYCTRVGEGPFPTELSGAAGDKLREDGHEYGTTTGRARRCGWIGEAEARQCMSTS